MKLLEIYNKIINEESVESRNKIAQRKFLNLIKSNNIIVPLGSEMYYNLKKEKFLPIHTNIFCFCDYKGRILTKPNGSYLLFLNVLDGYNTKHQLNIINSNIKISSEELVAFNENQRINENV